MKPMFTTLCLLITLAFGSSLHAEEISLERYMLLQELPVTDTQDSGTPNLQVSAQAAAAQPISLEHMQPPIRVLIDVRSNHSDGSHDFNTLINLARERHIDALVFTEHDRYTIRFGIDPIPFLFGYSQEHPSLYQTGVARFFSDLAQAKKISPITLLAGTESAPGYHWQGIPFHNLSLHDAEKHLITLGATHAAQIEALPSFDLRHALGQPQLSLIFWVIFIFLVLFRLHKKGKRGTALFLAASFIVLMGGWQIKTDIDPAEDFIAKAWEQNLFVIWTHPGTLSGVREGPMGVKLQTPPYSETVFNIPADAFAAVYGDSDSNTAPGGLWDRYLLEYIRGMQTKPVWAVAAGDFHEEGQSGEHLGNFPMDVWAKSNGEADIMQALREGKMCAWQMKQGHDIATRALFLQYREAATHQQKRVFMGEEAVIRGPINAVVAIHELDGSRPPLTLQGQWIVDGKIAAKLALSTDPEADIQPVALNLPEGRHVIRFQIPSQQGVRMESNPFFVQIRR